MKLLTFGILMTLAGATSAIAAANPPNKGSSQKGSAAVSNTEKLKKISRSKGVPTIELTEVDCRIVQGDPTPKYQITNPLSSSLTTDQIVVLLPLDEIGNTTNELYYGLRGPVGAGSTYTFQRFDVASSCIAAIWPNAVNGTLNY